MVTVSKIETIEVRDDNGVVLTDGDPILLRVRDEDMLCRFIGMANGYFVTETLKDKVGNKYRLGSIKSCVRIEGIKNWLAEELKLEG